MDWGKRGDTRAGFLDVHFIQIVRSLNYCSGLSSLFWYLKSLEKLDLKGIGFNALNLVLGNQVREQPHGHWAKVSV